MLMSRVRVLMANRPHCMIATYAILLIGSAAYYMLNYMLPASTEDRLTVQRVVLDEMIHPAGGGFHAGQPIPFLSDKVDDYDALIAHQLTSGIQLGRGDAWTEDASHHVIDAQNGVPGVVLWLNIESILARRACIMSATNGGPLYGVVCRYWLQKHVGHWIIVARDVILLA